MGVAGKLMSGDWGVGFEVTTKISGGCLKIKTAIANVRSTQPESKLRQATMR